MGGGDKVKAKLVTRRGTITGDNYKAISIEVGTFTFGGHKELILQCPEFMYASGEPEGPSNADMEDILGEIVDRINGDF